VESGDPLDKAGAYGIQSGAASLIDHIEGEYDTIIGLPTGKLAWLLLQLGIEAKPVKLNPLPVDRG
jgi:septum formation protein